MPKVTRKNPQDKPPKPFPDFPLFPHATRRWAKKILSKLHYFGPWDDPDGALERYLAVKDYLHAGKEPPLTPGEGVTIRDICNEFLGAKMHLVDSGELTRRTFYEYFRTAERVVEHFKATRPVTDLRPANFQQLRAKLAKDRGPVSLRNEINRVRILFRWGFDSELLEKPVRFGKAFDMPSRKTLRLDRSRKAKRLFAAGEIRQIVEAADPDLTAIVYLGINCAFGQTDCGDLLLSSINEKSEFIDWPRRKTGIARRCPIWPETLEALNASILQRTVPKEKADENVVFVTKYGRRWVRPSKTGTPIDGIGHQLGKLLKSLGIYRRGVNFYALRHTFRTVADEIRDRPAIDLIMGHEDVNDMAVHYREQISDDRLRQVTDHVHQWLYGG